MDAQRHFWENFHRITKEHWPKVLSPLGMFAAVLTSFWMTAVVNPQRGVLLWINNILTEVGGGFVEDWLQSWIQSGRPPSFQEVLDEVKQMKEEEREILERLIIKLDVLPALLHELSTRLDQHATSVTQELRDGFRRCEGQVLELKVDCLQHLIERLSAQHDETRAWQNLILSELRQLRDSIESMATRPGNRSSHSWGKDLTDAIARKIQEDVWSEIRDILEDDIV